MDALKLVALDTDDLAVVSAHVQDSVLQVADMAYDPVAKRFALEINRYVWEKRPRFLRSRGERRRALLQFDRVLTVQTVAVDRSKGDDVLNLLALRFLPGKVPSGLIEIDFSGGATIRLEVECIEARLADLGAAWDTMSRPTHTV